MLLRRGGLLVGGSAISAICYAFTIKAALGLGPLYVVQDGLADHLGITIGQSVMLTGIAMCVIAIALREWPGIGTVAVPFVTGAMVDAVLPHTPHSGVLAVRLLVVVVASFLMALGGALIIRSRLGAASPDLVMLGLSRVTRFDNKQVRLAMEVSWLAAGWLLGGAAGVGSVITGALIGPSLHFWIERLHSETPEHEHVVV